MNRILCIHGRRQLGKDPEELRRNWAAGLNLGLAMANRSSVNPNEILFPYYGNQLEAARNEAVKSGGRIELLAGIPPEKRIDPLMPDDVAKVESDLLKSLAQQYGPIEYQYAGWEELVLSIPGARRVLKVIADRTGVDQEVIESFLTDVAVYFTKARDNVLELVEKELLSTEEGLVIIAHSLGSLVAHDLLHRNKSIATRTKLLVTAGSPLGLEACYRNLLAGGPEHPGIGTWVTAYDPHDIVAVGHPLTPLYGPPLLDLQVNNPFLKAHSIDKYLSHAQVAARIHDALTEPANTE